MRDENPNTMSKLNEIYSMPYAERLNTIHRLRLLRNTTGELSAHTGIQLRNNSFSKKAPFVTRSIYSEFSREVRERTDADLDELLASYCEASRYFEKIANTRKAQPEFHRGVLRCLLDAEFAASEEGLPFRSAANAARNIHPTLLTLLILKILPSYESKSGEVDINSLVEHLSRLRDYLRPLYDNSRQMRFAPYLAKAFRAAVRSIRNGELFTRLELIDFAQRVIDNLKNNYDPEHLLQANLYINRCKIHPELGDRLWVEPDFRSPMPVYWTFEALGMDYIVSRKQYDIAKKHITETCYELSLYCDETTRSFTLMRQSAAENLCLGRPIPENAYMHGLHQVDDDNAPSVIRFDFTSNRYDDFPTVLAIADKAADRIAAVVDDTWTVECETGEWSYLSVERVITSRYIYVERDSEATDGGGRKVASWYRIPREGLLQEVDMETPVARIRHDDSTYIYFIPQNRSFDVTDATTCAASGIETADDITVLISAKS